MFTFLTVLGFAALTGCGTFAASNLRAVRRSECAEEPRSERRPAPRARPALRVVPDRPLAQDAPMPSVSVVIPTLNEEGSLAWVLEQLPSFVSEVVLVDGLSTDSTEAIARRLRPIITVVHQHRPGKGAALRAGFAAATGDILVMIDGDGSTDPREMQRFVQALRDGADFVKGSRHLDGGGSSDFTRLRSAGNRMFVTIANILYGSRFTDLCYGYCAFWREHLDALALTADGFEIETQLVLGAVKARLEIREVASFELERRAGASNLNAVRDGTRVLKELLGARPGRDTRRSRPPVPIKFLEVPLAASKSPTLLAGGDRRGGDRRRADGAARAYAGPERRRGERRAALSSAVAYPVLDGQAAQLVA